MCADSRFGQKNVWALLAASALVTIVLLVPVPDLLHGSNSLLVSALQDFVHFPLFACLTFVACSHRRSVGWRLYVAVLLFAIAIAAGTELAQMATGAREASWNDLRTDVLGAVAGLAIWTAFYGHRRHRSAITIGAASAVVAACTGLAAWPAVLPARIALAQNSAFPLLYTVAFPGTNLLVESRGDRDEVALSVQRGRLQVEILEGEYPGVVFWRFRPNWSGYDTLRIDIENLRTVALPLEIHIRDTVGSAAYNNRYNTRLMLGPGERRLLRLSLTEVEMGPESRNLRLSEIILIAVYRAGPGSDRFAVHEISLE